jgi:hypothetical protein
VQVPRVEQAISHLTIDANRLLLIAPLNHPSLSMTSGHEAPCYVMTLSRKPGIMNVVACQEGYV